MEHVQLIKDKFKTVSGMIEILLFRWGGPKTSSDEFAAIAFYVFSTKKLKYLGT